MAIYFFDKNQTLIKIVPESATFEAIQTQELDDDSLLKDTLSVTVKGDEKLLDAEHMAVKSYTGNAQTFDMYRIVTDSTPDKTMTFTGMSLAPYELNGHILKDLRPSNQSVEYTLNRILDGTDWRLGYIDDGLPNVTATFYYVSAKEALKELQSLVGCEFVFKIEISGQKITDKWIEIYKEMGSRTKKRFNYGTNALTVVRETNKADIYTALIGRGKGEEISSAEENESGQAGYGRKITFEDIEWSTANGNPLNKPIGQYYLELPQATQAYGIQNIDGTMKARVGIVDFDDEEDKNRLINLTYQQLLVSSRPKVLFKTTVANVGATGIGDTVTIHRHDLNIHYQTRVRKIVRNKLNDNKTQIELGDAVVTASTKQAKKNSATIKNLNQEIERVKVDVTTSQTSADGKNTINYGSAEPERKRTGDTWYRPHPSIAGETQMLVWNGNAWELVVDSSDLTSVSREVEAAIEEVEKAVQSAQEADDRANEAIEKAGANANVLTTHQNTLNTIKNTTLPNVNKVASDAMAEAQSALNSASSAMDEAKKADGKIADYVTSKGLVSGTTVDSKINTATGEISKKITTLETNKLDGNTYTNFYNNEYKQTVQGVTDTYTKVNKIIDANGNSTDAFAQAVYNRNATRQSADFKEVTKGLVKEATYTAGVEGINKSISTVQGNLDNLKIGGENLIVKNTLQAGYYINLSGSLVRSDYGNNANVTTDWIDISGAKELTFTTYDKFEGAFAGRVAFYSGKSESNFISTAAEYSSSSPLQSYTFTVPANAKYVRVTVIYGEDLRYKLEKGNVSTDWSPAPEDMLGKETFNIFKNDYDETAKEVSRRLTAIDSSAEGSVVTRLNKTESTASGNKTTISNIKTKPGEQITGYQTILERSNLYERVIGSTSEDDVKSKMARVVMTDSLFQTEVRNSVNIGGENLIDRNNLQGGYLGSNGKFSLDGSRNNTTTDWIEIGDAKELTFTTYDRFTGAYSGRVLFYSDKSESSFISVAMSYGESSPTQSYTFNVPTKAKYVRATLIKGDTLRYKLERGNVSTDYTDSTQAMSSKITQLADNINLKVSKGDLISQINVQAGGVLITSGTNKLNITPTTTFIQDATIKSAMIESLQADKITTGTLDAGKVKVVNIDANNITANITDFIKSNWNEATGGGVTITGAGVRAINSEGSRVTLENGVVSVGNRAGVNLGFFGDHVLNKDATGTMTITASHGTETAFISATSTDGKTYKRSMSIMSGAGEIDMFTTLDMNKNSLKDVTDIGFTGGLIKGNISGSYRYMTIDAGTGTSFDIAGVTRMSITSVVNIMSGIDMNGNDIARVGKLSYNSDQRLKTKIKDTNIRALDAIRNWQLVSYDWLENGEHVEIGLIAQNTPELMTYDSESDIYGIDAGKQTMVNTLGIQQLDSKVDNKVEQLEAKIASLQEELATLKGD